VNPRTPAPLLLLLVPALLIAACASKPDTRYRASVDTPPLSIPASLDSPVYSQAMEIPPARGGAGPDASGDSDIEKPPELQGAR
jgi:uncharacterized lipoprotein